MQEKYAQRQERKGVTPVMSRLVFVLVINLLAVSLSFGQSSPLSVNAQFGKIQTLRPYSAWISPKVADYLEIQLSTKPVPINEARNLYTKSLFQNSLFSPVVPTELWLKLSQFSRTTRNLQYGNLFRNPSKNYPIEEF